jgi:hypothetical protein
MPRRPSRRELRRQLRRVQAPQRGERAIGLLCRRDGSFDREDASLSVGMHPHTQSQLPHTPLLAGACPAPNVLLIYLAKAVGSQASVGPMTRARRTSCGLSEPFPGHLSCSDPGVGRLCVCLQWRGQAKTEVGGGCSCPRRHEAVAQLPPTPGRATGAPPLRNARVGSQWAIGPPAPTGNPARFEGSTQVAAPGPCRVSSCGGSARAAPRAAVSSRSVSPPTSRVGSSIPTTTGSRCP